MEELGKETRISLKLEGFLFSSLTTRLGTPCSSNGVFRNHLMNVWDRDGREETPMSFPSIKETSNPFRCVYGGFQKYGYPKMDGL